MPIVGNGIGWAGKDGWLGKLGGEARHGRLKVLGRWGKRKERKNKKKPVGLQPQKEAEVPKPGQKSGVPNASFFVLAVHLQPSQKSLWLGGGSFCQKKLEFKPPPTSATLPVIHEKVQHKSADFFLWHFQVLRPTPNNSWGKIRPSGPIPLAATCSEQGPAPPVWVLEIQSQPVNPGCTGIRLVSRGV